MAKQKPSNSTLDLLLQGNEIPKKEDKASKSAGQVAATKAVKNSTKIAGAAKPNATVLKSCQQVSVNYKLPSEVHKAAKVMAAQQGIGLREFLIVAVEKAVFK